jgi:hypothetical protein
MHAEGFLSVIEDLTPLAAERWVAAALAEEAALREHDDALFPVAGDDAAAAAAARLRGAWLRWANDADALLDALRRLTRGSGPIEGASRLDYDVGRARAMLSMTPELIQARRAQVDRGETFPMEEVRRELGLADRR